MHTSLYEHTEKMLSWSVPRNIPHKLRRPRMELTQLRNTWFRSYGAHHCISYCCGEVWHVHRYLTTYRCVITISILITLFPKSPCSIASTQHSCCTPAGFACASISCQKHVSLIISQRLTHCCVVDALKLLQTSHAVLRKQVFKIF